MSMGEGERNELHARLHDFRSHIEAQQYELGRYKEGFARQMDEINNLKQMIQTQRQMLTEKTDQLVQVRSLMAQMQQHITQLENTQNGEHDVNQQADKPEAGKPDEGAGAGKNDPAKGGAGKPAH